MPKHKTYTEYLPHFTSSTMQSSEVTKMLNEKAFDGWELITVTQIGFNVVYFFKRETTIPPKIKEPQLLDEN